MCSQGSSKFGTALSAAPKRARELGVKPNSAASMVISFMYARAAVENGLFITGRFLASSPASLAPRTGMTSDLAKIHYQIVRALGG